MKNDSSHYYFLEQHVDVINALYKENSSMVQRTLYRKSSPVLTFLTVNPGASKRIQKSLSPLLTTSSSQSCSILKEEFDFHNDDNDELNTKFNNSFPFSSFQGREKKQQQSWESSAIRCSSSGTILHFLCLNNLKKEEKSQEMASSSPEEEMIDSMSLISITSSSSSSSLKESVSYSRDFLAKNMVGKGHHSAKVWFYNIVMGNENIDPNLLFPNSSSGTDLPLFVDTNTCFSNESESKRKDRVSIDRCYESDKDKIGLKEIILPYNSNDDDEFQDKKDLLSYFTDTNFFDRPTQQPVVKNKKTTTTTLNLKRKSKPILGLYMWPKREDGKNNYRQDIAIRPIPASSSDMTLSPPSLIFHSGSYNLQNHPIIAKDTFTTAAADQPASSSTIAQKVGFTSSNKKNGQLLLNTSNNHKNKNKNPLLNLAGVDIRLCESDELSTYFSEAQDSLLAGSLDELQHPNVLSTGEEKVDEENKIGDGDCWVEFRSNMKNPQGFFKKNNTNKSMLKDTLLGFSVSSLFASKKQIPSNSSTSNKRVAKAPDIPYE